VLPDASSTWQTIDQASTVKLVGDVNPTAPGVTKVIRIALPVPDTQ
jgi:hypothetical protein